MINKNRIKNFLLDLFFPKFCFGCNKEGSYLCQDCRATLDICEFNYCLCNKKLSGLYFALPYKENSLTRKLIYQFKYEPYTKDLAKTLANLIIEHLIRTGKNTDDIWRDSALIPVPLDKNKLRSRGYNQSEELAKELSKTLNIPVLTDVLIKIKSTKTQIGLSGKEREKNLKNAFAVKNCGRSGLPQFSGKKVFLVDDVYTTGSTMEECATQLLKSGAKSVWGIVIAREG